jgi:peroxiredoxin
MNQKIGSPFPDLELSDHEGKVARLSQISEGFPIVVDFYRGYW